MNFDTTQLRNTVQHNCDISDARFARDYSMCIYLLRMQEYYRWKQSIPLDETVDGDLLGDWVRDTETYWDDIEENEFKPITIGDTRCDPFDAEKINAKLERHGLAYTAGIGRLGQPHFVLAECTGRTSAPHPKIDFGRELARDSITLPAMTCNGTVFIRHDGIVRMIWQMIAEWRLNQLDGPMKNVIDHYQIDTRHHTSAVDTAATDLSSLLIHHEYGEIAASEGLGEQYRQMIMKAQGTQGEAYLRAVADLYADSLGSWRHVVDTGSVVHLNFWLAGLFGIREKLFKSTDLYKLLTTSKQPVQLLADHLDREQMRWHHVATQLSDTVNTKGMKTDYQNIIDTNIHTGLAVAGGHA